MVTKEIHNQETIGELGNKILVPRTGAKIS